MEFRILGPLEVVDGDGTLLLGGPKQRVVLAMLLLHANEVVSTDRLIEALWAEKPPKTAVKTLQVYVSHLRKLLGSERLETRPSGYALRVANGELDLDRFQSAYDEERFQDALAYWRGPPLADFVYDRFAQGEIARLESLRLACLEDFLGADLARGRHAELAGELAVLVREHPLRERLRALLMVALYRSGRQAEALDAYQDARGALSDELGLQPSRELRELQQAILRQDPALELRPRVERAPEPARSAFVGRERELAELVAALEEALIGHGRLVLVAGEPGIGKSRLADELVGQARARGVVVLIGRCWEAGGAPAYWPWVQSLRAYVRATEPGALRTQLGPGVADLAQLLPEIHDVLPSLPRVPAPESEGARFRLFEAVSSFFRRAAQDAPLVLVLDDLHAADEPSLLLLQFLARELADSRLLVVCAYRDVDPTMRDPLASALAELVREPQTRQIALAGLSEPDVAEYIGLSTGIELASERVEAIYAETDGNPLFVAEVVRLLDAEGGIADPGAHLRIPPGVRAVIGRRVGRLSERCRRLLVPAAVLGREFDLQALARLGGLRGDEVLDVLDEAMTERIVGDVSGAPGRYRFEHALIRDTLYDDLTPARRMQLHRDAGAALETVHSDDLGPHLAELAYHFFESAPAGEEVKAIEYARLAADRAASQLAYEEAVRLCELALALIRDDVARCELLLALGDAQARTGDTPASKQSFRQAAELAEGCALPEHFARAALGYGGRLVWHVSRDDDSLVPLLERALAALGDEDSTLRVRLLARLAGGPLRDASFPSERRLLLSEESLEMARRIDDAATLAYALAGYISAQCSPAYTHEQVKLGTELLEVAMETRDLERAADAYEHRGMALLELGEMRGKADLEAMANLASELRQPSQVWLAAAYRTLLVLLEGRFDEAEVLISEARDLGERALSWDASVTYRLQLYVLRREQGRLEDVLDIVRSSVDEYPTYPIWRCVQAQMEAELGHATRARNAIDWVAADGFAGLPFNEEWLVSMCLLAEAARLVDAEHASALYDPLRPYEDHVAVSYPDISIGSVARYLGILAATMERWEDAERHFEDALAMNDRIGARPWLAHTQRDYARMLLTHGNPGDTAKAVGLLDQAIVTYRELGMESYASGAAAQTA